MWFRFPGTNWVDRLILQVGIYPSHPDLQFTKTFEHVMIRLLNKKTTLNKLNNRANTVVSYMVV